MLSKDFSEMTSNFLIRWKYHIVFKHHENKGWIDNLDNKDISLRTMFLEKNVKFW